LALRSELLILTNVCPALTFVPSARILWSHNPSFVPQISTVFGYNFPLALTNAFVTFGDFCLFYGNCRSFIYRFFFSPLQEDNVAIAIAMNGINIFHEYDLIYFFFTT
jgi:hypothetical protein